jgi:hypothetical protein
MELRFLTVFVRIEPFHRSQQSAENGATTLQFESHPSLYAIHVYMNKHAGRGRYSIFQRDGDEAWLSKMYPLLEGKQNGPF